MRASIRGLLPCGCALSDGRALGIRPSGSIHPKCTENQKHSLWGLVGAAMQRRLSTRPVWLSTAGAGVSRLHVRLDDQPKYMVTNHIERDRKTITLLAIP